MLGKIEKKLEREREREREREERGERERGSCNSYRVTYSHRYQTISHKIVLKTHLFSTVYMQLTEFLVALLRPV